METIARIRRDHPERGIPIRQIARDWKLSRNTVRKAIRGDVAAFRYKRTVQPLPKLGPWVAERERLLEANEGKRRRERLSEAPNGWIKQALGFRRFSVRGLDPARGEWAPRSEPAPGLIGDRGQALMCLALNMKRMQGLPAM